MYFIHSGTIEVTTKDGSRAERTQGDFFGEGAMLDPQKIRSATIRCKTPVHAMEISRKYFDKYIASSDSGLLLTLKEKDKIRKRNRAKTILKLNRNLTRKVIEEGETYFQDSQPAKSLFILEEGRVDIVEAANGAIILSVLPGNLFGEHSLITGKPRNCSAICSSPTGCSAQELPAEDFQKILKSSPSVRMALKELHIRREFKKAVVRRLQKEFPYHNPQEAFLAANPKNEAFLDFESVTNLMRDLNPDYTTDEIKEILKALDLNNSGKVDFEEFKKIFIADIRTSASM
jgi:CRP-like cAMP-binding protein